MFNDDDSEEYSDEEMDMQSFLPAMSKLPSASSSSSSSAPKRPAAAKAPAPSSLGSPGRLGSLNPVQRPPSPEMGSTSPLGLKPPGVIRRDEPGSGRIDSPPSKPARSVGKVPFGGGPGDDEGSDSEKSSSSSGSSSSSSSGSSSSSSSSSGSESKSSSDKQESDPIISAESEWTGPAGTKGQDSPKKEGTKQPESPKKGGGLFGKFGLGKKGDQKAEGGAENVPEEENASKDANESKEANAEPEQVKKSWFGAPSWRGKKSTPAVTDVDAGSKQNENKATVGDDPEIGVPAKAAGEPENSENSESSASSGGWSDKYDKSSSRDDGDNGEIVTEAKRPNKVDKVGVEAAAPVAAAAAATAGETAAIPDGNASDAVGSQPPTEEKAAHFEEVHDPNSIKVNRKQLGGCLLLFALVVIGASLGTAYAGTLLATKNRDSSGSGPGQEPTTSPGNGAGENKTDVTGRCSWEDGLLDFSIKFDAQPVKVGIYLEKLPSLRAQLWDFSPGTFRDFAQVQRYNRFQICLNPTSTYQFVIESNDGSGLVSEFPAGTPNYGSWELSYNTTERDTYSGNCAEGGGATYCGAYCDCRYTISGDEVTGGCRTDCSGEESGEPETQPPADVPAAQPDEAAPDDTTQAPVAAVITNPTPGFVLP